MKFVIGSIDNKKSLTVDAQVLADTRALICASSGAGKSMLLRHITEQVAEKIQTIIVDPEGEFPTLREKLDILVVGENGDVQANVQSAGLLARKLAETGVSAVIDIYDLPGKGDPWDKRRAFVAEFLTALMNLPKSSYHPMLIIIDEAHQFAPEAKGSESSNASRSAVNSLMSAGRKRGFGGILATQRISKIHKDSIADARNIFIGGTTLDIDQQRAGDMLGMSKAESVTLRELAPGEFYCYGPATGDKYVKLFHAEKAKTTHPKAGQRANIAVPKASSKIEALTEQFGDLPSEAQAEVDERDSLRRKVFSLEKQIRERPVQIQPEVQIKEIEVPVIQPEQIEGLASLVLAFNELGGAFTDEVNRFQAVMNVAKEFVADKNKIPPPMVRRIPIEKDLELQGIPKHLTKKAISDLLGDEKITGPEQKILDSIAWFQSIGNYSPLQTAVAFLAGYSSKSKTYTNPRSALKRKELVEYRGDCIALTETGNSFANSPQSPLTAEEIQSQALSILPGPEKKILTFLLDYPLVELPKPNVAGSVGYNYESKTFTNPLSRLRSLGLVDYPKVGMVRAMPFLFLK